MNLRNDAMGSTMLTRVHEGMHVHDVDNNHIGSVRLVYFGAASEKAQEMGKGPAEAKDPNMANPVIQTIADVLDPGDLPEAVHARLLQEGFIRIDSSGLFASDRYAVPEQIASVSEDVVRLNVHADHLISRDLGDEA